MHAEPTRIEAGPQRGSVAPPDAPARARELIAQLRSQFQGELEIAMSGEDDRLAHLEDQARCSALLVEALRACLAVLASSSSDAPDAPGDEVAALAAAFEEVLALAGESARITGVLRDEVVDGLALLKNVRRARAGYGMKPRACGALFDVEG